MENLEPEDWKELDKYPGYSVSSYGRIMGKSGSILKPQTNVGGYLRVCLHVSGRKSYRSVHSLVLEAFVCQRPDGLVVRHLNGVRTDNHKGNLVWGTGVENYADKFLHGTAQIGERHGSSKLTDAQVREILLAKSSSNSRSWGADALAQKFGVHSTTVLRIGNGKLWQKTDVAKSLKEQS